MVDWDHKASNWVVSPVHLLLIFFLYVYFIRPDSSVVVCSQPSSILHKLLPGLKSTFYVYLCCLSQHPPHEKKKKKSKKKSTKKPYFSPFSVSLSVCLSQSLSLSLNRSVCVCIFWSLDNSIPASSPMPPLSIAFLSF